jgi:hypothetical protein
MQDTISSLRDLGYKQAQAGDVVESMAQWAIDHIAGFPETTSPEAKSELFEGYRLRYSENKPAKTFVVVDGNYLPEDDVKAKKSAERVVVSVDFAFSFSNQEFGKLKTENPNLHGIVGKIRKETQTYCSNRFGALVSQAKRLINHQNGKPARTELTFVESLTKMFEAQEKSCKIKQAKGDAVANVVKYKMAVDAFWSVLR